MPDLNNLGEEDEHSHRIDTDADGEAEEDVMITEVEKPKQRRSKRNITLREDSGTESDEEFVTHELFEDKSNNNKMVESKGSSKYLISTKKNLNSVSAAAGADEKSVETGRFSTRESR